MHWLLEGSPMARNPIWLPMAGGHPAVRFLSSCPHRWFLCYGIWKRQPFSSAGYSVFLVSWQSGSPGLLLHLWLILLSLFHWLLFLFPTPLNIIVQDSTDSQPQRHDSQITNWPRPLSWASHHSAQRCLCLDAPWASQIWHKSANWSSLSPVPWKPPLCPVCLCIPHPTAKEDGPSFLPFPRTLLHPSSLFKEGGGFPSPNPTSPRLVLTSVQFPQNM